MEHRSSYTSPRSSRSSGSRSSGHGGGSHGRSSKRNTYDRRSWMDNRFLFNLVCIILPFALFNGILFVLVTSEPKIELTVADTKDYKTVDISFEIKSLLPLREMTATLESGPLELEKDKKTYRATLSDNGTLELYAKSWNGMSGRIVEHIATLDDAPPSIDDEDFVMEGGILTIKVQDSQSGINFSSIYATNDSEQTVKPRETNKDTGEVTFDLENGSLNIYVEDMAGNPNQATFSLTTTGIDTSSRGSNLTDGASDTNGSTQ